MPHKRLWLGVATLILVQIVLSNLFSHFGSESPEQIALRTIFIAFIAAFAGGLVARKGIVLPAIAVWLILWIAIAYMLYKIAEPVAPASFGSIIEHNWVAFLGSGVATVLGATLGQWLATLRQQRPAAT